MTKCLLIFLLFSLSESDPLRRLKEPIEEDTELNQTRRILGGREVGETRPYMVYLRQAVTRGGKEKDPNWLCGGVIIHPRYVLTSAACIEDVQHFYVVSGTHTWVPATEKDNACIKNGAKKAVWKCVPKDYVYDGGDFDNIRWMENDIAVVKVEDDFNFEKRIKGCDFIPKLIPYNNFTEDYEKAGTRASVAGWGTTDRHGDIGTRSTVNSPKLLDTSVTLISKKNCKKRWAERYHYIIDRYMICGKDGLDMESMSNLCSENDVNCKELVYSDEEEEASPEKRSHSRRVMPNPEMFSVHTAGHMNGTRRAKVFSGGFCENDHGGPLVFGEGKGSLVVGIISACMTRDISQKCYGPFLYTSVWQNRNLINCAIYKDSGVTCKQLLRTSQPHISETSFDWSSHPDGPAKNDTSDSKTSGNSTENLKLFKFLF